MFLMKKAVIIKGGFFLKDYYQSRNVHLVEPHHVYHI